jgi:histidinol-phosphatase
LLTSHDTLAIPPDVVKSAARTNASVTTKRRSQRATRRTVSERYHAELAFALELADLADAETLPRYRQRTFTVDRKQDNTEVTEADRGAEAAIRRRVTTARPDDAVLGEEDGLIGDPGASWRWIVDPVDGTSNFVKAVPIWATLIALEHEGELVVGVCSAPALGRRWWAARGAGAYADGSPVRVSSTSAIAAAHLAYSDIGSFARHGRGPQLSALAARAWRARGLGDFWMHVLVAEGAFDAAMEPIVSLWDLAALQVIVEEAGGRFTNLAGEARSDGGSAVSSNGVIHDEVLAALA